MADAISFTHVYSITLAFVQTSAALVGFPEDLARTPQQAIITVFDHL